VAKASSRVRQCRGCFACDGSAPAFHVCALRAHSGSRRGGLNSLSFSHFQPQKLNLLVRDHRTPEASATWPKLLDRDHRTRRQHATDSANLIVVDLQE